MNIPWQNARGAELLLVERTLLKDVAAGIAQQFKHPVMVNIGVYRCASMYCLRAGASEARIVGVDILPCPAKLIHPLLLAEFIIADSRECHTDFKDTIHFLFIDGDHRYPTVMADIVNWAPKVVPGGVVAFHDYAPTPTNLKRRPHLAGVKQAVDEWHAVAQWRRLPVIGSMIGFRRPL